MNRKYEKFYGFAKWKNYFDYGYAFTSYIKYMIALFGLTTLNVKTTLIAAVIYGVFCIFFGRWAYKSGLWAAEIEVHNSINPFVEDMRKDLERKV